jgi:excisionase family DNA binding protein
MTSEEIAELLHVDPVTIRRLVTKGELSAYRIGSDYRFAPSDLADYLQRQRLAAPAQKSSGSGSNHPLDQFAQVLRNIIQGKHTTPSQLLGRLDDLFTKRARHVLTLAQEEAQHFQHDYIGTEHLLLGLLREREGAASQVLNNLGIEVDRVRDAVIAIVGHGERMVSGELGLTPRAKKAIELALDEARRFAHRFIGTEHLLLGLIREGDGIAARALFNFDLHLQQVRAETLRVLREQPPAPEEASGIPPGPKEATGPLAEEQPGLTCASCGARCPSSFRYCFHCGHPLTHEDESSQGGQE